MLIFVIKDEANIADLTAAILKPRTSRGVREAAADAIRSANPGLDLENLRPGELVVLPRLEGMRASVTADPAAELAAEVVEQLQLAARGLVDSANEAVAAAEAERQQALKVLDTAEVTRLADEVLELRNAIDSYRETAKQDAALANKQAAKVATAVEGWLADLDDLRALMGG